MSSYKSALNEELTRVDQNVNGLYEGIIPEMEAQIEELEARQRELETEIEDLRQMISQSEDNE